MDKITPYDQPSLLKVDQEIGEFSPFTDFYERRLSQLADLFCEKIAVEQALTQGDPVLYDVRSRPFVTSVSDFTFGITRIYPGTVGGEYYMTKGHFHLLLDQPEIYYCLQGNGCLLMESAVGDFKAHWWVPGTLSHIPPGYAHRVVNTGNQMLIFSAIYRLSAGHDYGSIARNGFAQIVVEREGRPELLPNPQRI